MHDVPHGDEDAAAAEAEAEAEAMAAAAARSSGHGYVKTEPEMQQQQQRSLHVQDTVMVADRSFNAAAAAAPTAAAAAAAAARAYGTMPGAQQQLKRPRDVPPAAAAAAAAAAMETSSGLLNLGGPGNKSSSLPTTAGSLTLIDTEGEYAGLFPSRRNSMDPYGIPSRGLNMLGTNSYELDDLVGGHQGPLLGANSTGLMTGWPAAAGRPYKRSRQSSC
jgi:hypothetical protein